jgi:hypothetical protein
MGKRFFLLEAGLKKFIKRSPWIEGGKLVGMKMDGQPYRFVRVGMYQGQTGNVSEVSFWECPCKECGNVFEAFVKLDDKAFQPSRRCGECIKNNSEPG